MGLFSGKPSYLGIDFDANSIKLVELKNEGGRPRLQTYGFIDKAIDQIAGNENTNTVSQIAELINQVCAQAKVTTTKAITALPSYSVFSSILNLPAMSKKDLAAAVKWEAKKVIPLPIDEMILDWKLLDDAETVPALVGGAEPGGEGLTKIGNNVVPGKKGNFLRINSQVKKEYVKVLLTAAAKDLVKKHIEIFKAAGLTLLSLDTESFALIRSLVGNDKSTLMVVDIGAVVTNISIVKNSIPVLNRSIEVGGLTITKAIANSLNINLSRAEQFKYDIGMKQDQAGQGSVPKTIETTLTPIVDELRYSLNLYRNKDQKNIEKVILTGGSSLLLNLAEYLSKVLDLRVFLGDPWARIIYPQELKPVLDEIGPRFSVAVGLAMRDIE